MLALTGLVFHDFYKVFSPSNIPDIDADLNDKSDGNEEKETEQKSVMLENHDSSLGQVSRRDTFVATQETWL
jgi:hypothetical protein